VRKSIYVLAGLGLAGAIALSAMLRQVLETQQGRQAATPPYGPYAAAVQEVLRGRLVGSPRVQRRVGADGAELHAAVRAAAGNRAANVAALAGAALWQAADAAGVTVVRVAVEVAIDGGATLHCEVPRGAVLLPRAPAPAPQPR
jgi:hypothetical protein